MSDTPVSPPPDEPLRVPSRTTPTWEVELLISGALIFSLLSLRQPLEDAVARWTPVLGETARQMLIYGYLYGKMALYTLALTFILHLAARARWVALVGVDSIYPGGPKWENINGGPITRRLSERLHNDIAGAIERADNAASLIFAFGILTAMFAISLLLASLGFVALMTLGKALGLPDAYAWTIGLLLLVPLLGSFAIDRWIAPRLSETHWLTRGTERVMHILNSVTLVRITQPLMSMITTNYGGRRGIWILMIVLYFMLGLVALDTTLRRSDNNLLDDDLLPSHRLDNGLTPAHYARLRTGTLAYSPRPHIEAEIVKDPYLRLVLPYVPSRHGQAMREQCPEETADEDTTLDKPARLSARQVGDQVRVDCFSRLFELHLDGKPIRQLDVLRYQDSSLGLDGAIAMIDVRDLAPGRHTLTLRYWPRIQSDTQARRAAEDKLDETHETIVFWR